jgi:hypothetical protein
MPLNKGFHKVLERSRQIVTQCKAGKAIAEK